MSYSNEHTIIRQERRRSSSRGRTLLIAVLVLTSFSFRSEVNASTESGGSNFFGLGAGVRNINSSQDNSAFGAFALNANTTGSDNSAFGFQALANSTVDGLTAFGSMALQNDTTGFGNTAVGFNALNANSTGIYNTATGLSALKNNTTGDDNTAFGANALLANSTGIGNMASGAGALQNNTTGSNNTAVGFPALFSNSTGGANTATGRAALYNNTTGNNNTAAGFFALVSNTTGAYNTASGYTSLFANTTGIYNTAEGTQALRFNTTGGSNSASGLNALYHNTTGNGNSALGFNSMFSNTSGSYNIALGYSAGSNLSTGTGNIDIGNVGVAGEGFTIRIGSTQNRTFLAGVRNAVAAGGVAVYAAANGQLGTNPSSKRFKQDIADMDRQSEAILALRPVSFHYKEELDSSKTAQFGLIAEEVAKVNPDLVARDDKGDIYSVRYEAVNAMLLNEFLKEHSKVQEQQGTIDNLKSSVAQQQKLAAKQGGIIAEQQKQIDTLAAGLQKVSAQVAASTGEVKTVSNE